nr:hypothetical protein [Tanacetum cinerariifolium]
MLPVAPQSPDYIPGLEEPQTPTAPQDEDENEPIFIQPHELDFVPEPIYPEYTPLEDEHILLVEEQPLPLVVSPTAESSGDDGDNDDDESSGDDTDNEDEEDDEEEEEEHLAPANSAIVTPTNELVAPPKGIEPVIPPPSTDTATTGARITVRLQAAISLPPEAEVKRLLAMPTPSPSPLTSLSPPSVGERLARCTAPAALPSLPLPPPLRMPPPIDCRDDIPETEIPPHKRLYLSTLGSRCEVGESSTARPTGGQGIDYGDTWIDPTETGPEIAPMTVREMQQTEIAELRDTGRRRQAQMAKTFRVMEDMRREIGDMQAELLALRE